MLACTGCPASEQVSDWVVCGACVRADAVSMWAVPIPQRPAGQAMQVITMHLFGDVPSPPITGAIQGTRKPSLVGLAAWPP